MLRLCKQSSVITKKYTNTKPILYHSVRFNTTNNNNDIYSHKVTALPFKLPEEKVHQIVNIASYMSQHAFFGTMKIIKSIFTNQLPNVKESASSLQIRKAYLPLWYYDMAVTVNMTPSSSSNETSVLESMRAEHPILGVCFDSFWPGHTWDPMCYLSFGQTLPTQQEKKLVPFTPALYSDIEVLPFTVDPLFDLEDRVAAKALEQVRVESKVHPQGYHTLHGATVLFNAAYPIYWPVYVAQFTDGSEEPKTVVIGAHSEDDPPVYQWEPTKQGVQQWVNNGRWLNVDVTETEWRMAGFGQRSPLDSLMDRFSNEVVGQFQTHAIDWDDLRIQSYAHHQAENKDYLKQLYVVWAERDMLSRIEDLDDNMKTIGVGPKATPQLQVKTVREMKQDIQNRVAGELEKLKQLQPAWVEDYIKKKTP